MRVARGKVPDSCDAEVHSLTREKLVSAIEKDGFCPDRPVILKNQHFQDAYDISERFDDLYKLKGTLISQAYGAASNIEIDGSMLKERVLSEVSGDGLKAVTKGPINFLDLRSHNPCDQPMFTRLPRLRLLPLAVN